ncbi:hypothetical protein KOW79_006840 [Hemibagrus wyckioides]|uniref:Uncharacterized protein n=1 Tax=Hemibagrus wyckioides TaxID=337641 RepID=A0A9D3STA1_9TELE|nr:hypothetical protein KOW79_006840 [Hemibagrus wyckioides]
MMFSRSHSLLLVLLILRSDTTGDSLTPEECCVHFSFTLPSSKPSTSHEESRLECPERVVMIKSISSPCEDHDTEWLQNVIKAYDWCLMKGYMPKQDSSKTYPVSIGQFLDAKTTEDCCYLFSQSPDQVFTPLERKMPDVCEKISFNVTLRTNESNCMRNHIHLARDFIRKTYNCLKWAF